MNNKLDLPFYISTNNKHLACLRVFTDIFDHFLPNQELRILGYNRPQYSLPKNCNFISLGKQGEVNEWSTDIRNYFLSRGEQHFIYGTEDSFIYKKPNVDFINYLSSMITRSTRIGRINLVDATEGDNCLLKDSPHYSVAILKEYQDSGWGPWSLCAQYKHSNYSLTTQLSIWNKDFMIKYLTEGLSPWDFERQSHKTKNERNFNVLMVDKNYPIYKKEGYSLGTWTNKEFWMPFLSKKTRQEIFGTSK